VRRFKRGSRSKVCNKPLCPDCSAVSASADITPLTSVVQVWLYHATILRAVATLLNPVPLMARFVPASRMVWLTMMAIVTYPSPNPGEPVEPRNAIDQRQPKSRRLNALRGHNLSDGLPYYHGIVMYPFRILVGLGGLEVQGLFERTGEQKHCYGLVKKFKIDKGQNLERLGRILGMFNERRIDLPADWDSRNLEEKKYFVKHGFFPTGITAS